MKKKGGRNLHSWYAKNPCEHRYRPSKDWGYICDMQKVGCMMLLGNDECPNGHHLPKPEPKPEFTEIKATDLLCTRMETVEKRLDRLERFFL